MSFKENFGGVLLNECKHQTNIDYYSVQKQSENCDDNFDKIREKFYAFQEPISNISEPKVCLWEFLKKEELEVFLKLTKKEQINLIDSRMNKNVRGIAKTVFIDLMFNTMKFCKSHGFNLEKTAAVLSQFYLTHIYYTSALDTSAEKVFAYFKKLCLCHSLPFPPQSSQLFSHKETKIILEFFCKLYLRNLPLIRFLSLPNFALLLNYILEPEIDAKNEAVKVTKDKKNKLKKEKSRARKGKKLA